MERVPLEPGLTMPRSAAFALICIQHMTACGSGDPPAAGAAASTSTTITAPGAPSPGPPSAAPAASAPASVLAAGNEKLSATYIRQWQFLDLTVTGPPTWEPDIEARVGAGDIQATVSRGVGYRSLPGGKRETHEIVQLLVPIVDAGGAARRWVQVLGMWDAAEPHMEREVIEAMKSLR